MAIKLRSYQQQAKADIFAAWQAGHQNVLLRMPTGAGKTKTFCSLTIDVAILAAEKYPTTILVHRKELVQQISLTLAEEEIVHNIIAPRPVIKGIIAAHRRVLRRQYYDYNSIVTVVSVDTLNARIDKHEHIAKRTKIWITDEATHLLKNNKWGRAVGFFPGALGLGVTATPQRLDKKGLGRHADGVFDVMVNGPETRWLIDQGFLCKYKIAIPPSDYERFLGKATSGSDYSKEAMIHASRESHIIGDVVANYQKFANGKQAILFADSIETAIKMEKRFNSAGIAAKLLTGETGDKERLDAMLEFRDRKTKVLINVDLFDEGLDVPGIESVIMARPTMSLSKYLQMVGRGLRPSEGKPHLVLIDHVGNVLRHGLPDAPRSWTLDRIIKRREKVNLIRICSNISCNAPYDRILIDCPYCKTPAIMSGGGGGGGGKPSLKEVDGDLELLDIETLRQMEADAELEDPASVARRVGNAAGKNAGISAMKAQAERIATQKELSNLIARWAGYKKHSGYTDRQIHKLFYLEFEHSITGALSRPRAEMLQIMGNLQESIPKGGSHGKKES